MLEKLKKVFNNIKHLSKSLDEYNKDTIIQSMPVIAYVNRAKKFIEAKEYDKAIEVLKAALDISNRDPLIYKYLGKISEFTYKFKDASVYYKKSAILDPNDKEIWLRLGMCYLYSNKYVKASDAFRKANKVCPGNTDVFTGWGITLMKQKKYALAKDKFNMAAKISKYNFNAILMSALMEIRLGEYSSAEEKLNFLIKVAPNEGSLYEYAHLKFLQNKYDEALKCVAEILSHNKLMLPAYFVAGEIYSIQKDYDKTEQVYCTAENLGLRNATLYSEWGRSLVRLLDFVRAREMFDESIAMDNNSIDAKIGLVLLDAYDGIFNALDKYKDEYSDNAYIQEALGIQMFSNEDYENAIIMFKKVLDQDVHANYVNYLLAEAYIYLNRPYKVREYFDIFTGQNPQYSKGLVDYAKWLINASDYAEAQRKLQKAQKIDEKNPEIMNLLFLTHYTLAKKNICEYNVREAISIADKALELGKFDYLPQRQELENILIKDYQEQVN